MISPTPTLHFVRRSYKRFTPKVDEKKAITYFTISLSLLSLSFFGLFAIRPTIITAISLFKEVADLEKMNKDYEGKIGSLIMAQAEYEKIRNSLPQIEAAIPNNASFPHLAQTLEKFADNPPVKIDYLQIDGVPISEVSKNNKLQKYNFLVVVVGNYSSLSSYLSHILNWKRLAGINELEFVPETSTTSAQLRLTIKGTTYYSN